MASAKRQLWDLLRRPESILSASGAEPFNPAALQIVPQVNYTIDLFDTCASPAVPSRLVRATSPAVLARRSVVEIVPTAGEVRFRCATSPASPFIYFAAATQIQANRATINGGTFLYTPQCACIVQVGDRAGGVDANDPALLPNATESWEMVIQPGFLFGFYPSTDNVAMVVDFLVREFNGQLDSVMGG